MKEGFLLGKTDSERSVDTANAPNGIEKGLALKMFAL